MLDSDPVQQRVNAIFDRLRHSLEGLVAVGLADANGLPIAFLGPVGEKTAATAMATLLVTAAHRASMALGLPPAREVVVDSEGFTLLVAPVGAHMTLIAILAHEANIGYARLQIQTCSNDVQAVLATA